MPKLGVNIDHVATVREARKTFEPDPVEAALQAEKAGCDGIVCHLRKDRRHINDDDLGSIKEAVTTRLNLEMSVDPQIVDIACGTKPDQATIVPENRREVTTEGGLDVAGNFDRVKEVISSLAACGIEVSLFIDPEEEQVKATSEAGAKVLEFHTGRFCEAFNRGEDYSKELEDIVRMTKFAIQEGLTACAGHGLNYQNAGPIARIEGMHELNIGHSIISRAVFVGLYEAVREMKDLIK
ncbi:MAG: pyridoxine 5'-phosphate synthase [Candidatus Omnitrophica bacterium]|nr:pyridoxine 5'-phosphate synthase [Candidatus Omnitrophota bacterium]